MIWFAFLAVVALGLGVAGFFTSDEERTILWLLAGVAFGMAVVEAMRSSPGGGSESADASSNDWSSGLGGGDGGGGF